LIATAEIDYYKARENRIKVYERDAYTVPFLRQTAYPLHRHVGSRRSTVSYSVRMAGEINIRITLLAAKSKMAADGP